METKIKKLVVEKGTSITTNEDNLKSQQKSIIGIKEENLTAFLLVL